MQDPIFIVGAPGSGTSLVAGVIHYCGAPSGAVVKPTPEVRQFLYNGTSRNPKGFFENLDLIDKLYHFMAKKEGWPHRKLLNDNIEGFLKDEFGKAGDPWSMKFLGMLNTDMDNEGTGWPLWKKYFPKAKWVIVQRPLEDIFSSVKGMSGPKRHKLWAMDAMHQIGLIKQQPDMECYEIWPFSAIKNPQLIPFKELISNLGLEWNNEAVLDFVDPSLCHHDIGAHAETATEKVSLAL
ncbi:MAG: hypothetical protein DHS20C02_08610 [Micavibrio sp.]|nr:MAG: hypothetical protein DHS20C02_08610 [Micavibrio sp.]